MKTDTNTQSASNLVGMFDDPTTTQRPQAPDRATLNQHYKNLFPEYRWDLHGDCMTLAKEFCWFYDDMCTGKSPRWISALGQTGTGKTEWAKRVKSAASRNMTAQMFHWSNVCDDYLAKRDYGVLDYMANLDFLVIDEIGLKDWKHANRDLSALLNKRLGRWTVITSNLTQAELADIDARIASRLVRDNNRIVTMKEDCPDYSQMLYKQATNQ
jgi:DNA replication protein DnaC